MSPGRNIPLFEIKTARPEENKAMGKRNKNFAWGSVRGIVSGAPSITHLDS